MGPIDITISEPGILDINKLFEDKVINSISIQIDDKGSIWICANGQSVLRFKQVSKEFLKAYKKRIRV